MIGYGNVHNSMCTVDFASTGNTKTQGVARSANVGRRQHCMLLTCCTLAQRQSSLRAPTTSG